MWRQKTAWAELYAATRFVEERKAEKYLSASYLAYVLLEQSALWFTVIIFNIIKYQLTGFAAVKERRTGRKKADGSSKIIENTSAVQRGKRECMVLFVEQIATSMIALSDRWCIIGGCESSKYVVKQCFRISCTSYRLASLIKSGIH